MLKDAGSSVSRRSFLKGMTALGAGVTLYGCSKDDGDVFYGGGSGGGTGGGVTGPDVETDDFYFGTGGHNCGGNCLSKAWVKNGRIVRITSDSDDALPTATFDPNSYAHSQSKACSRCRAYKYRLYHPGRLKYPLKQTKLRGDLSGFIRMSWDEILDEICRKHKALITKYGPECVHSLYACGSYTSMQGGGYTGIWNARSGSSLPLNYIGGSTGYTDDYSFHQSYYATTSITGMVSGTINAQSIAGGREKHRLLRLQRDDHPEPQRPLLSRRL